MELAAVVRVSEGAASTTSEPPSECALLWRRVRMRSRADSEGSLAQVGTLEEAVVRAAAQCDEAAESMPE